MPLTVISYSVLQSLLYMPQVEFALRTFGNTAEVQDLGKKYPNGTFEVLGRFDNSDIRGCNLMVI
ncbi:MAG: hypothetical protein EOP06_28295 [Proteobacteria bacterium]|nr:MAG: hypothetical protein EOP06_28295 [Pseudomonadota bacterium]